MVFYLYLLATLSFAAAFLVLILTVSYYKRERTLRGIPLAALMAIVVEGASLVCTLTYSAEVNEIARLVYFSGTQFMLMFLWHGIMDYTNTRFRPWNRALYIILWCAAAADLVLLILNIKGSMLNIPNGLLYSIPDFTPENPLTHKPVFTPLSLLFLGPTCIMVVCCEVTLFRKRVLAAKPYKQKYSMIEICLVLLVILNFVYLLSDRDSVFSEYDFSTLGHGLLLLSYSWGRYSYSTGGLMRIIVENATGKLSQGFVIFDNEGYLVSRNAMADHIFLDLRPNAAMYEFLRVNKLPLHPEEIHDFRILSERDGQTYFVEYRDICESKGRRVAHLFMVSSNSDFTDIITGCPLMEPFLKKHTDTGKESAVVFDINNLRMINTDHGPKFGDAQLQALAAAILRSFPAGTVCLRGPDAVLIAVTCDIPEVQLCLYAEEVKSDFPLSIEYGVAGFENEGGDRLLQLIDLAQRTLTYRKLLNSSSTHYGTIQLLVNTMQTADIDTKGHVQRTMHYGAMLADAMGLTNYLKNQIMIICLLHDIGKLAVPMEIVNKAGGLTESEWEQMRQHTTKGYEILKGNADLDTIAYPVMCHHERWDGKGYPKGLSGEDIPLFSRIISVVDSYDAMTSNRVYRQGMTRNEALGCIRDGAGTQFDPKLAALFIDLMQS